MKDHDAIERQETTSRELIAALGQLTRDVQAPPDFAAWVLAQADQQSVRRPTRMAWRSYLPWGVGVAVAAVLVLHVRLGAPPQDGQCAGSDERYTHSDHLSVGRPRLPAPLCDRATRGPHRGST